MAEETSQEQVAKKDAERDKVLAWEMERFWDLGFTLSQCEELVRSGADWHDADRLLRAGCTKRVVYRILV